MNFVTIAYGVLSAGTGLATWTTASFVSRKLFDHRLKLWQALAIYGVGAMTMFGWVFLRKRNCTFQSEDGQIWTESIRLVELNPKLLQQRNIEQVSMPFWSGRLNVIVSQN